MIVKLILKNIFITFFENYDGRIIAAAKASNIVRVQEIFQAAAATGRHVFLTGRDAGKLSIQQ